MSYYFSRTVDLRLEEAVQKVTEELKKEGFGVLTEIDVKATLKQKLGVDFRNYRILGACNPTFAHQAFKAERMIGALMPCNVVVQDADGGKTEVAAVDPLASMQATKNPDLEPIARMVRSKLRAVIEKV